MLFIYSFLSLYKLDPTWKPVPSDDVVNEFLNVLKRVENKLDALDAKVSMLFGAVQAIAGKSQTVPGEIVPKPDIQLPKLPLADVGDVIGLNERLINNAFNDQMVNVCIYLFYF